MKSLRTRRALFLLITAVSVGALVAADAQAGFFQRLKERREARQAARQEEALSNRKEDGTPGRADRGLFSVEIEAGGRSRNYLMYVPSSYKPGSPTPLVLTFHGGGDNAKRMAQSTRFPELAEREGFIVAFPNGTFNRRANGGTWNTGSRAGMGQAEKRNVDDLSFIRATLARIKRDYSIDSNRIYATGMSKGGMFSYYLGCNLSDEFAAIAPISSTMVTADCRPTSPVALFHIHGTADESVPLNGGGGDNTGGGYDYPPVRKAIDFWRKEDRCSEESTNWSLGSDTKCETYKSCVKEVTLCLVDGGGHAWPGQEQQRWQKMLDVYVTHSFDATAEVWRFFEAHPKR